MMSEVKKIPPVMAKGYGIVYKDVMRNPHISIKAKGIYCYLASYCGHNGYAYPSRSKILYDLNIGTSAYYKHYNSLIENNILTVISAIGRHNRYIINNNDTIKSKGYGMICKSIMINQEIDISAKALYCYLCTYAAVGETAHPSKEIMLYHLNISDSTYQKLIHQLVKSNYITVFQSRTQSNGMFSTNYYYLNSDITEQFNISDDIKENAPYIKNQNISMDKEDLENISIIPSTSNDIYNTQNNQHTNKVHTNKPHIKNIDIIKRQDYNNTIHYNYQSIKKLISNILYHQESNLKEIKEMIDECCGISEKICQSPELIVSAIKVLCNFNERSNKDYWNNNANQEFYHQTVAILAELALCGGKTSCAEHIISCINNICIDNKRQGYSISLEDFIIEFVFNYTKIFKEHQVKNYRAYMSVCLENELKTYLISITA